MDDARVATLQRPSLLGLRRPSGHREQSLPLSSSIAWTPSGDRTAADPAYPIFIRQQALAEVQAHVATRGGAGAAGFLGGELLSCPDTGRTYVVIDSAIRAPFPAVDEDDTKRVMAQGWDLAQEAVRSGRRHVVGWYHSHPGAEATLSAADADAHLTFFDRPWHVALVVTPGSPGAGGLFSRGGSADWACEPLPFYELSDEGPFSPHTPRPSVVGWGNYHTDADVVPAPEVTARASVLPKLLLYPDEFAPEPPRMPRARGYAKYALLGALPAAAILGLYLARGSATTPPEPSGAGAPAPATSLERLDRLADTVALATAAYDLRASLFASRRMGCPDLARGLVEVEERWMSYSLGRRTITGAPDAARSARDKALDAQVDTVERRFERSPCPRP